MSATVVAQRLPNPALTNPFRWDLLIWFGVVHLCCAEAIWNTAQVAFSGDRKAVIARLLTVTMASVLARLCHLSITMGPHRLWAHQAYKATKVLEAILLAFFSATLQNTVPWWSGKHLEHHAYSDTERDPYTVLHGFWWAHVGWILRSTNTVPPMARRLVRNPLLKWHQGHYRVFGIRVGHYLVLGVAVGALLPTGLAWLWGDPWGGLLIGCFFRLCIQYHGTWCINSVAHYFGPWRYSPHITARTCYWLVMFTAGEWNHEGHHHDSKNPWLGNIRPTDYDPGGRWIRWCTKVGLASY